MTLLADFGEVEPKTSHAQSKLKYLGQVSSYLKDTKEDVCVTMSASKVWDVHTSVKRQRWLITMKHASRPVESWTYAIETSRVIINTGECSSQWCCSDWWTHVKQNPHHGRDVKQTSTVQTLSDKLFLILSVLNHSDFTDVISKKNTEEDVTNETISSASTWSALMVYQFEVYVSLARALSYMCTGIVTRFSFMIMQLLSFRFKNILAHHFRATGVISQFLGWDTIALGFLDKHSNRWQETRSDWCATVFGDLGLNTLLHWRQCRADIRHNFDDQFLLDTFANLPSKWWIIWTMFSLSVEQYVTVCPYEQEISKQHKLASNSKRYKKSGYEILGASVSRIAREAVHIDEVST